MSSTEGIVHVQLGVGGQLQRQGTAGSKRFGQLSWLIRMMRRLWCIPQGWLPASIQQRLDSCARAVRNTSPLQMSCCMLRVPST